MPMSQVSVIFNKLHILKGRDVDTETDIHGETPSDVRSEAAPGRGAPRSWGKGLDREPETPGLDFQLQNQGEHACH